MNKIHSQNVNNQQIFSPDLSPVALANSCFKDSPEKPKQQEEPLAEYNTKLFTQYSEFVDNRKFSSMDKREYGTETEQPKVFHPQN
jgi:hypothetical protein